MSGVDLPASSDKYSVAVCIGTKRVMTREVRFPLSTDVAWVCTKSCVFVREASHVYSFIRGCAWMCG